MPRPAPSSSPSRPPSTPTLPEEVGLSRQRRARFFRRLYLTVLAAFILAGLAGVWGVRDGTAFNSSDGWTLEMEYPKATRAGLAVPLTWTITKAGGFGAEEDEPKVVVRITQDYFDLFDENGFDPEPSSSWSDGEFLYWEFDAPPDHDIMIIRADTRTGSGVQLTAKHAESAIVFNDQPLAPVKLKTWVAP